MNRLTEWNDAEERWIQVQNICVGQKDLNAKLAKYENTGLEPEDIECLKRDLQKIVCTGCWLKDEKHIAIKINNMKELLERAAEEIENSYGYDTGLTVAIRAML